MACNRLRLDFSLQTTTERVDFLNTYLTQEQFVKDPPNEEELDMMGKYILWGKDPVTGKNGRQLGLHLETKHGTWDDDKVDSLDQLMEQPTFNEAALSALGTTQFRAKKEVFSREEALANCDDTLREQFNSLFHAIDELELSITLYELNHGKRTKEVRPELLKRFSEEELCTLRERVTHWNQYKYLRKRHQLVEMRREQYTLRDSYKKILFSVPTEQYQEDVVYEFDVDIQVLPLGVIQDNEVSGLVFRKWTDLTPDQYAVPELKQISDLYWQKNGFAPSAQQKWIDFRDLEHVYQLLNYLFELEDAAAEAEFGSNISPLLRTLQFYVDQADLTDIQREILDMKLHKKKNTDIAWDINHKYNKTYTPNYISTIFRQRIIPRINEAAAYHEKIVSNVFFPEEFKRCTGCGEMLMRCPENFTRKSRATDGYSARCKRCEKKARQGI